MMTSSLKYYNIIELLIQSPSSCNVIIDNEYEYSRERFYKLYSVKLHVLRQNTSFYIIVEHVFNRNMYLLINNICMQHYY